MNELLLILSIMVLYGSILLFYYFTGKEGLYAFTVFVTILANIEVLIIVNAFGMEMTLGNIMFACTFLITDILSENHGKEAASKSVKIGIMTSILFIIISQMWLHYIPAESDWASPAFHSLFANTPRLVFASLVVYAVTQIGDVWLYHKWWNFTKKKFSDDKRFLWLRNNGSTLISQFFNSALYTLFAFGGLYNPKMLFSIFISSYVIFIVTSLIDTPVIYLARKLKTAVKIKDQQVL